MAPPPPPIALFPPAPNVNLVTDTKLQSALDAATKGLPKKAYGLTIVDTGKAPAGASDFPSASVNGDIEHYAASMLKVACMYAAFSLRDLAQRFNMARKPNDSDDFFKQVGQGLDPLVAVCCPMLVGHAPSVRLPKWRDVFTATGNAGALSVNFTHSYAESLFKMIVPSDNGEAGRCIRGVGYAYLNGVMRNHGFFDETSKQGVWLAGDYSGAEVVTIPCDNDRDTKQGTTSAAMARLGVAIFAQRILSGTSSTQMVELLRRSSHGSDSSYFARSDAVNKPLPRDRVTHGKIGLGDLKKGGNVYSDLNALTNPVGGSGDFTVCYTNVDYNPYAIQDVLTAVQDAISSYQGVAVTPAVSGPATAPPAARVTPPAARATP